MAYLGIIGTQAAKKRAKNAASQGKNGVKIATLCLSSKGTF
jgi:hypothetical protein